MPPLTAKPTRGTQYLERRRGRTWALLPAKPMLRPGRRLHRAAHPARGVGRPINADLVGSLLFLFVLFFFVSLFSFSLFRFQFSLFLFFFYNFFLKCSDLKFSFKFWNSFKLPNLCKNWNSFNFWFSFKIWNLFKFGILFKFWNPFIIQIFSFIIFCSKCEKCSNSKIVQILQIVQNMKNVQILNKVQFSKNV
jgi:hypothetical protein